MAETSEHPAGTRTWADLSSPDLEASKRFYRDAFDWDTGEPGDLETTGGYMMFRLRGKNVAGLGPLMSPEQPPAWTCYFATDDADKTTELVGSNGGTVVVPPMEIPDAGRMALYADPTGAFFGVWQAGVVTGAEIVDEPGAICWFELTDRDPDAAREFYPAVFGLEAKKSDMEGLDYTTLNLGDQAVAGLMKTPDEMPADVPSYWMPYFEVADTDHTVATAQAGGANVMLAPHDIPTVGRIAVLADPQGASFGVIQAATA